MKNHLLITCCILLLGVGGCAVNHLKCPQFVAKKGSGVHYTASRHVKSKPKVEASVAQAKKQDDSKMHEIGTDGLAGSGNGLELKIPKMFSKKMNDNDIEEANHIYKSASGDRVSLIMKGNKLFLKAKSAGDVTRLIKVIGKKPAAPGGGGGGIALAAGILGIIAFVLAFGPYANFLAIVLAIIAIVLGIVGLSSGRLGWAFIGIIFGILALAIAGVFIGIVYIRFI